MSRMARFLSVCLVSYALLVLVIRLTMFYIQLAVVMLSTLPPPICICDLLDSSAPMDVRGHDIGTGSSPSQVTIKWLLYSTLPVFSQQWLQNPSTIPHDTIKGAETLSYLCLICSGKSITKCCLSQHSGHFYIGTEGGNLYTLDVKLFELDSEIVYWNNATTL